MNADAALSSVCHITLGEYPDAMSKLTETNLKFLFLHLTADRYVQTLVEMGVLLLGEYALLLCSILCGVLVIYMMDFLFHEL